MVICVRDGSLSAVEVCVGDRIFFIKRIEDIVICGEKKEKAVVPLLVADEIVPALKEYIQENFGGSKVVVTICDDNRKEIMI